MGEFIKQIGTEDFTLEQLKQYRYSEIDNRTGQLIDNGFSFAGNTFSLSQNAQINILALDVSRNDAAIIYPIEYNTLTDDVIVLVPDATTVHNMYLTALGTKKAVLDSGTVLKNQIRAAVDKAAVNVIIDNR